MREGSKNRIILLRIVGVLALLVAVCETGLFFYARSHLSEILRNDSAALFYKFITVTENAALVNPHITTTVFCVLLSVACFTGAHLFKKKQSRV